MNNFITEYKDGSYIFFSIGTARYAFDAKYVQGVVQLVELEYPETMPEYILGLFEYHNQIIKVVDLKKILNEEDTSYGVNAKIIVVKTENDVFGVITDAVLEIKGILTSSFNTPPYNSENSYLEAIYSDSENSATIINLEQIEKRINADTKTPDIKRTSLKNFLPQDLSSKELLHKRKLRYTKKMREVTNVLIESQDTFITFRLNENICCLKILHVSGFYKYSNLKMIEIPCVPDFIKGVASVKGRYITIVDLLKFSEGKETKLDKDATIIAIEHENCLIGILAGAIGETIDIDESQIKVNSENKDSCLIEQVFGDSMYLFLNIDKLFKNEKLYIS